MGTDDSPNNNEDVIIFNTSMGNHWFAIFGDCCSTSWIEHISGVDFLLDAVIKQIDIESEILEKLDEGGITEATFYKITTDKGSATIEFRNSSNGYYSGSLEPFKEYPPRKTKEHYTLSRVEKDF